MIDMMNKNIIPSMKEAGVGHVAELQAGVTTLKAGLAAVHAAESSEGKAQLARTLRLETMTAVREVCDAAEAVCPEDLWTLATYRDLLFLDQTI